MPDPEGVDRSSNDASQASGGASGSGNKQKPKSGTPANWFLHDGKTESEPLTEPELRRRLVEASGAMLAVARVRQGNSEWFPALDVLNRFKDLAENGIYLRRSGDSTIEGPFTAERAVSILTGKGDKQETWRAKIGRNARWLSASEFLDWHALRTASTQPSQNAATIDLIPAILIEEEPAPEDNSGSRPILIKPGKVDPQPVIHAATLVEDDDDVLDLDEVAVTPVLVSPATPVKKPQSPQPPQYVARVNPRAPQPKKPLPKSVWLIGGIGGGLVALVLSIFVLWSFLPGGTQETARESGEDDSSIAAVESRSTENRSTRASSRPSQSTNAEAQRRAVEQWTRGDGSVAGGAAPVVPSGALFRPTFDTTEGQVDAGSAFAIKFPGSNRPIIMTALHLFGPAGGLDRDIHPMRVSSAWQSTSLVDCVSGQSFEQLTGKPLSLAFTAPYPDKSRLGDVAAYMPDEVRGLAPFTLSSRLPSEGEVVWLVSPVLDEESLVHRAKILGTQDGWLAYQFDELIEMRATSGAAVIDSAGDVVAVNVAGGELQGYTVGLGTPASSFYKDLQIAAGLR